MKKINDYIYNIKKSPLDLHIKLYRNIKRNLISKTRANYLKSNPLKISDNEFFDLTESRNRKDLINKINKKFLFKDVKKIGVLQDKEIISEANRILNGNFNYLGNSFKINKINWHKDFKSGRIWPLEHYSKLTYENLDDDSDVKIVWDFNRFHHIVKLGIAYSKSRDIKYVNRFKEHIEDWIKNNPVESGVNWLNSMEVAIRAINWIYSFYLFKDRKDIDEEFWNKYLKMLYFKGNFIKNNLEWSPKKENHYLSDIAGLFFLGVFFINTKFGKRWLKFAKTELEKEILNQVSKDGVHYESSINYHRLVTELFMLVYINGIKNNIEFSDNFKERLEKMIEFIMYYTKPSGNAPTIGDSDDGRIIDLWDHNLNDHRELLTIGSVLFNRSDFKKYGKYSAKTLFLMGYDLFSKYKLIQKSSIKLKSKKFTDFYIIRDNNIFLIIHCGSIGRSGFGGHGHNDQLSFEFSLGKKDIIVDPGTYVYTSDVNMRHLFRSTASHNCLQINNFEMDQITKMRPFSMIWKSKAKMIKWGIQKNQIEFIGEHYGFKPYVVRRSIIYDISNKCVLIKDNVLNGNPQKLSITYTFNSKKIVKNKDEFLVDKVRINLDNSKIIQSVMSTSYGIIKKTNCLHSILNRKNEIVTKIHF
ncbi:MAG: alginate lyase family protein [archaeon]